MADVIDPFAGTIELSWPGKQCHLKYMNSKWQLKPFDKIEEKRALLFESRVGNGERNNGYAIKADIMSSLKALQPYISASVQFIYFDAPRLNTFQSVAFTGYTKSTWLSLIQQVALLSMKCLKRTGFLAVHTDEEMAHYSKIVLDEVFGSNCYVGTFAWQKQYAPQNDLNVPTDVIDYITVYSKMPTDEIDKIGLLVTPKNLKDDGDFRGCYVDGHKGARSGSESTKFKVNTSPYRWEIVESNFPEGRYHFDKVLGTLWFESVDSVGEYNVTVKVTDKKGNTAVRTINFKVKEPESINDEYSLPSRIWWLLKEDNDIKKGGKLNIVDLPEEQRSGVKGQEFSLVFRAEGGEPYTMKSDSPGSGRYWEFGKQTLINGIARGEASFGDSGSALPSIKKFFDRGNAKKRQAVMNFLPWYDYGHTQDATQHCKVLKSTGIVDGEVNMMAKPQKLIGHLISLLAPSHSDIVMSIGDTNGVFASVANKLGHKFIHIIGAGGDEITTWDKTASKRIIATFEGRDTEDVEGNDSLPGAAPTNGYIDILRLSDSVLKKNIKNGDIEPEFSGDESINDFYAGLSGAYRVSSSEVVYKGFDNRTVFVVPEDETLDPIMLENIRRKYPSEKLFVIYESMENEIKAPKNIFLRRAPFELI